MIPASNEPSSRAKCPVGMRGYLAKEGRKRRKRLYPGDYVFTAPKVPWDSLILGKVLVFHQPTVGFDMVLLFMVIKIKFLVCFDLPALT